MASHPRVTLILFVFASAGCAPGSLDARVAVGAVDDSVDGDRTAAETGLAPGPVSVACRALEAACVMCGDEFAYSACLERREDCATALALCIVRDPGGQCDLEAGQVCPSQACTQDEDCPTEALCVDSPGIETGSWCAIWVPDHSDFRLVSTCSLPSDAGPAGQPVAGQGEANCCRRSVGLFCAGEH